MRLKSASVSGWASGSARAVRSISASVIGREALGVLPEVVILLSFRSPAGGNKANAALSFRVDDQQYDIAFGHPGDDKPLLLSLPIQLFHIGFYFSNCCSFPLLR
jgi:hypothetical protein